MFKGFPAGNTHLTPIPAPFFHELLPYIDDLGELKLALYVFWQLDRMEGVFRYLRRDDFIKDKLFISGLCDETCTGKSGPEKTTQENPESVLDKALQRCVTRGLLLQAEVQLQAGPETLYFLNSPKGRAAIQAIQRGEWRPSGDLHQTVELAPEPPNIFRLYEEHVGPLTPLIADALSDAETTYPPNWIEEAFRIAVENNARNWRYIAAILKRWQDEGRYDQKDRRDTEKDRRKYIEGEYADYIEH